MLNRYRGRQNHAETWRSLAIGGLLLTVWGTALAALALAPGAGRISVIGTAMADDVAAAEAPVQMATAETVETR